MSTDKEYFAFISYKREDEKWAEWLQHKLEHYRLPVNVRKENAALPQTIRPIFKDTSELAAGVLAEEIRNALENSKFLIVVCSPRAAQSEWVGKEVQTFIDMGRSDKIIPFIIGGTPFSQDPKEECFPSALLNLPKEQELLGVNINEMGRDAAVVKVVARMFDLKFDTLWQRYEREQKRRRMGIIGGISALAILAFVIAGIFISLNKQLQITIQQLAEERDNLKDANNTYSKLSDDLKQYTYSGELFGNGDGYRMCDYHPNEPIVAFSDNWGFWLHYLNSGKEILLPTDEYSIRDAVALSFSVNGEELMAEVAGGEILIWNVRSNELIQHYERDDSYRNSKEFNNKFPMYHQEKDKTNQVRNLSLSTNYDLKDHRINIYDKNHKKICSTKLEIGKDSTFISLYNPQYDEILFITDQKAALYDDTKKEFVLFFKGYHAPEGIEFSESGEYLRIDNDIYTRAINQKIDTIRNLKYTMAPIAKIPKFPKEYDSNYDIVTHSSLEVETSDDDIRRNIIYRRGDITKKITVLKSYTMGNGQECVVDALFVGSDKIIAIVDHGRYRIYNTRTGALMGTLDDFIFDFNKNMEHEKEISHAESGVAKTKYIDKKLYIISTGGIIRVYNVDQYRLETVIELPFGRNDDNWYKPIDVIYFADDGSHIYYSIKDDPYYYQCELPDIK